MFKRLLLVSALVALAACGSPTGPNTSETNLPPDQTPPGGAGGHFQPLGPICPKMAGQLCAPTSARQ